MNLPSDGSRTTDFPLALHCNMKAAQQPNIYHASFLQNKVAEITALQDFFGKPILLHLARVNGKLVICPQ